jgi:hypothetical protein
MREAFKLNSTNWGTAIADEFQSLVSNRKWEAMKLPTGIDPICSKWGFQMKVSADGSCRYKARLVIRGFEQKQCVDYNKTFALVVKFVTIRILSALATVKNWEIHQMEVKMAFMNPLLKEEVYMANPEGYIEHCGEIKANSAQVLSLLKIVNWLKKAPKEWYDNIHSFFLSCGLRRSNEDHNLYLSVRLAIVIYFDDLRLFLVV